ncbi:polysaccharide biosynthesis/export family protein [Novosphingobium aquimarinum]|uniref:polysaccharide biosynthesis/export family protein n=1 Tax=Novosphingobium aquimarinum TaxID=2682494 RepID=UPI0012EB6FAA|nr:polysaccharide biosynthesis/export family protein [Novosphingobium aquimarinum]
MMRLMMILFGLLLMASAPEVFAAGAADAARTEATETTDTTQASGYRVGTGDILNVSVYRAPDYSTVVEVGEDGAIALSMLGKVQVAGLSATQISDLVARRLQASGIFRDPVVNVLVQTYRSNTVSVLGHVSKPGEYPLDRATVKMSEMLARSGAELGVGGGNVELIHADGGQQTIAADDILSGAVDLALLPKDTLIVNEASKFFIIGEVNNAGTFPIDPGLTFARALALAGGTTPRGSRNSIKVTRASADGEETFKVSGDQLVRPNDLIIIGARLF